MCDLRRHFHIFLLAPVLLSVLWTPAAARSYNSFVFLNHPEVVGASSAFVEVRKLQINKDDKILVGRSPSHDRRQYKNLYRAKFEDLRLLEWSGAAGMMRVMMANGNANDYYCYPSKAEPRENSYIEYTAMQAVLVTGEFMLQGKKTKKQIRLGEIRAIVFVDESETADGAAYRWARSHDTAEAWREFFRIFPSSPRASVAGDNLIQVLLNESEKHWEAFQQEGPLAEAAEARQIAEEILKSRANEPRAVDIRDRAVGAEQQVRAQVEQLAALVAEQKWDEALSAHTTVARFAPEIPSIADLERQVRQGSHDVHWQQAQVHLKAERFEQAIEEFKLALSQVDHKETRSDLREANIRLALRDAGRALDGKQFESAHRLLQTTLSEQGAEPRMLQLLAQVKKDWAERLLAAAKPLYTVAKSPMPLPKGSTVKVEIHGPAMEARHIAALEALEKADKLSPQPETDAAITEVRDRLASYYFTLGQKKLSLPKGAGLAQAHLYLQKASSYNSQLAGLSEAAEKAREGFQRKSSIEINIALTDKSVRRACGLVAAEIEGLVGEDVTNARLPGTHVVKGEGFERLTQEHSQRGIAPDVRGATVQVLGEILTCESRRRETPSWMPSEYISGYRENPEYYRLVRLRDQLNAQAKAIDRADDRYKACEDNEKRQGIYGTCRQIRDQYRAKYNEVKSQRQDVERALAHTPSQFPIITSYTYTRKDIEVEAMLEIAFRIADSLGAVPREQDFLCEEDTKQDFEIQGAMPEDTGNVTDRFTNLPSEEELFAQQVTKIHRKLTEVTTAFLRNLPEKYLERARQAKNRKAMDDAAENYILFLTTTPQKSGRNWQEAERFLLSERNLVYRAEIH